MPAPIRQLESVTSYLADGATTAWNFSFASGYLNKAHVKAYTVSPTGIRADLTVTLGMFLGPNQLSVTPAVTSGYELNIYRDTPTDAPLVNFADTASFTETSLDTSTKQAIFAAAETVDALSIATERVTQINALVDTAVTAAGTATTKAGLANGSAIAAGNSAAAALLSEQNAAASALSVVQSNLVHITGAETVTGNKTFSGTTSVAALSVTGSAALPATTTGLTKTTVGLGNVDNVADVSKPVSTAQQTALNGKADLAGSAAQDFSAKLLNGGPWTFRNKVRNPKMDFVQRGVSFSIGAGASGYCIDGWNVSNGCSAVYTLSQAVDSPAGSEYTYSHRVTVTTADASVGTSDLSIVRQPIEGFLVRDLQGQPIAIRFDVKSPKTGTHCISLVNSGADRSYVMTYNVTTANTWQSVTLALPGGLITAGTWNWTNGIGVYIVFTLMAGLNWQTAAGAWQTGNLYATAAQVNVLDTIGNVFAFSGVSMERGTAPGPLEHRDMATESLLNMRYFEKSFDAATAPANSSGLYTGASSALVAGSSFIGNACIGFRYKVDKRAIPTLTFYNPRAGGVAGCISDSGGLDSAITSLQSGQSGSAIYNSGSPLSANAFCYIQWAASAEL